MSHDVDRYPFSLRLLGEACLAGGAAICVLLGIVVVNFTFLTVVECLADHLLLHDGWCDRSIRSRIAAWPSVDGRIEALRWWLAWRVDDSISAPVIQ